MERYLNRRGNSSVRYYKNGVDYIEVTFSDGSCYLYNYIAPGVNAVEHLKQLAQRGIGLNSYISRVIRKRYARKLR